MKGFARTDVINRFSAISTSFRAEFARQLIPRRKLNLRVSTILSKESATDESAWLESLLEIWHQGAMVFDESGETLQATEFTEKMIEKYFSDSELNSNNIPLEVAEWMEAYQFNRIDGIAMTHEPFSVEADGSELRIRLIVDNRVKRKTLLLRETTHLSAESLTEPLGLTKREAEVLFLITKGKTNPEIGILLDISPRTVQKHVEHIYIKLGVETRTAAMLRVNELDASTRLDDSFLESF